MSQRIVDKLNVGDGLPISLHENSVFNGYWAKRQSLLKNAAGQLRSSDKSNGIPRENVNAGCAKQQTGNQISMKKGSRTTQEIYESSEITQAESPFKKIEIPSENKVTTFSDQKKMEASNSLACQSPKSIKSQPLTVCSDPSQQHIISKPTEDQLIPLILPTKEPEAILQKPIPCPESREPNKQQLSAEFRQSTLSMSMMEPESISTVQLDDQATLSESPFMADKIKKAQNLLNQRYENEMADLSPVSMYDQNTNTKNQEQIKSLEQQNTELSERVKRLEEMLSIMMKQGMGKVGTEM